MRSRPRAERPGRPAGPTNGSSAFVRSTCVSTASRRISPLPRRRSLESFLGWSLTGFLGLGLLTSFRLIILPLLVIALVLAARRYGVGVGTIGIMAGAGIACLGIGIINLGNRPCPSGPALLAPGEFG